MPNHYGAMHGAGKAAARAGGKRRLANANTTGIFRGRRKSS